MDWHVCHSRGKRLPKETNKTKNKKQTLCVPKHHENTMQGHAGRAFQELVHDPEAQEGRSTKSHASQANRRYVCRLPGHAWSCSRVIIGASLRMLYFRRCFSQAPGGGDVCFCCGGFVLAAECPREPSERHFCLPRFGGQVGGWRCRNALFVGATMSKQCVIAW